MGLIGSIPATDMFAGRSLDRPIPGGALYQCRGCLLGFRWPRLDKEELDRLYANGDELTWTASAPSRRDWCIARDWVEQTLAEGSSLLDVGCFDGGFLEPLVKSYDCSGVEIHPVAAKRAEQKGITVIGNDFSKVAGTFDCITAFDIIEHVEQPQAFLADCLAAVRPGGWIFISTGNLDAFTFRLMGGRYWYCTIAEHISFLSPEWFSGLAESLNYSVVKQTTFAHGNATWSIKIREAANNLLYRIGRPGFSLLRKIGMGGKNVKAHPELAEHPPTWGSAPDHFMILIQKR